MGRGASLAPDHRRSLPVQFQPRPQTLLTGTGSESETEDPPHVGRCRLPDTRSRCHRLVCLDGVHGKPGRTRLAPEEVSGLRASETGYGDVSPVPNRTRPVLGWVGRTPSVGRVSRWTNFECTWAEDVGGRDRGSSARGLPRCRGGGASGSRPRPPVTVSGPYLTRVSHWRGLTTQDVTPGWGYPVGSRPSRPVLNGATGVSGVR